MDWIYDSSEDNRYRFVLGTAGDNPLICVGVNPSTAEPDHLDKTLESVNRMALSNGFDSWIMINLYPQRATEPNDMDRECNVEQANNNFEKIKELLSQYQKITIWAAWGTLIEKRPYLKNQLKRLIQIGDDLHCEWITFGKRTIKGHPHHPLYLSHDSNKQNLEIDDYYSNL